MPVCELVVGEVAYRWEETTYCDVPSEGWAHHGVAVTGDGTVLFARPDQATLGLFDSQGRLCSQVETDLTEMHKMTVVADGEGEAIWVADNGHRCLPSRPRYSDFVRDGRIVLIGLDDGDVRAEIPTPEHEAYELGAWSPCAVAVDEKRLGGSGDIWVADGYGKSLLHRFNADGALLTSLDGSESGRVFDTPHDVVIDRRHATPELYVADRANQRIVVYSLDGEYLREVGVGSLTSPSGLVTSGELLIVAELQGAIALFDGDDNLVERLGETIREKSEVWPNALDENGNTVRPTDVVAGRFNSPHGVATDDSGTIYVSEWLIGGRLVRLIPS